MPTGRLEMGMGVNVGLTSLSSDVLAMDLNGLAPVL